MNVFIVNVAVMNVYQEPSFTAPVVTQALMGESCTILRRSDHWYNIRQWDGYEGWANGFYGIVRAKDYSADNVFYDIQGTILDKEQQPLRTIVFGSRVDAHQKDNKFMINLPDGHQGQISRGLHLSTLIPSRESIVELAKSFTGIPYRWGGISTLGFDCSGFVQTLFRVHDINLPRDAHQQEAHLQEEIEQSVAQPGDLMFFIEQERVSHVAISLGNHQLINARGWVRAESLDKNHADYSRKLDTLYYKTYSVEYLIDYVSYV